ncbi:MAG: DUF1727 domain-containing protein [Lachnospiraceae bacterium]|nr:DUF1727 domain-containing protein [Lachnospiraceae bacterium]
MFRTVLAVAACKACRTLLRLLKRGGTALPGKVALKIDPGILEKVSAGMEIFVITGTNGKTTTSRMLEHALEEAGEDVLANKSGANLLSGVTAEFTANASLTGRAKKHTAVIECDEGALKQVVPRIRPRVITVTNLFRDQLDRYGEVMHTRDQIREGLRKAQDAVICLNADCSLTASLADEEGIADRPDGRIRFFGVDIPAGDRKEPELSDAVHCIKCGTRYAYRYHTYAHLGSFYCPQCGYSRPDTDTGVTGILEEGPDHTTVTMHTGAGTQTVTVALPALYNVYNALAAVTAFSASGRDPVVACRSLESVESGFGRMETFTLGGNRVQVILVKNPAGANQSVGFLSRLTEPFAAVLMLNDRTADGHDISWIWDVDYEGFMQNENMVRVFCAGDRAADLALRLKYAGGDEEKIEIISDPAQIADRIENGSLPAYVLPNYTSLLQIREIISKRAGHGAFWEG